MAKKYTPSQYLKRALERDGQWLTVDMADYLIEQLRKEHVVYVDASCFFIDGSAKRYIPKKYLNYVQRAYVTAYARMLFERSSKKIGYAERYRLAQKIK